MKTLGRAAVLAFGLATASAQLSNVDIQVVLKRGDLTQPERAGHRSASEEQWNYDVTVENKLFQPLTGVEARYMIFYSTETLGSKEAPEKQHVSGRFAIGPMQPHEKRKFTTDNVELKKASLSGHRHYVNGGRIKAQDTIVGVWVRVFQGEQLIGEHATPTTLTQEQWQ